MNATQHQRAAEVFLEACELLPADRSALLERVCGSDVELRTAVERLLAHDDDPKGFERGAALRTHVEKMLDSAESKSERVAVSTRTPERIDGYHILDVLGEGGFGTVYRAEQLEPVRRPVAIKIIKPGMDTRSVINRFNAERQTLAIMSHPGIATVFDAGVTDARQPYFVMECVPGVPILRFCDEAALPTRARIELFIQVGGAVEHAHQKGIIHRDIKPSNVLVTMQGDRPLPKLIDFGIAKAITSDATGATLTSEGQFVGTPAYMSPEQAAGERDIDTRSDIFSMGVLLYELVSGTTPLERDDEAGVSPTRMLELIQRTDPPTPSTRLRTLGPRAQNIARQRRTDPVALHRLLRGDLDWIVMKAIEKERGRRYQTIAALLEDLGRFLREEPVLARPPSGWYRFQKFARRHRGALAAAGAMMVLLIGGIVGTGAAWLRAAAHQQRAETINRVFQSTLETADPFAGGERDPRVSDAMRKLAERLNAGEFEKQPEIEAELCLKISSILRNTGHSADALPLAERALRSFERLHAGDHADVAKALNEVGSALQDSDQMKKAEPFARRALEMTRRLYSGDHAEIAGGMRGLAVVLQWVGKQQESEQILRDAIAMYRRIYAIEHADIAKSLSNLGMALQNQGRGKEAEQAIDEALAMFARLSPQGDPTMARAMALRSLVLQGQGRLSEAEQSAREALQMARRLLPPDHPEIAVCLNSLALALVPAGRNEEALPLLREALDVQRKNIAGDHPQVAWSLGNIGSTLMRLGRPREAEPHLREALEMFRRLLPEDNQECANFGTNLAICLDRLGRRAEALELSNRAADEAKRAGLAPDHFIRAFCETVRSQLQSSVEKAAGPEPVLSP